VTVKNDTWPCYRLDVSVLGVPAAPAPPLTFTSVTPDTGPAAGGTPLTIVGTGLTGVYQVLFDPALNNAAATDLVVVDDRHLTCGSPWIAGPKAVDIAIYSPDQNIETTGQPFTYT
jgi:hypothetical protein